MNCSTPSFCPLQPLAVCSNFCSFSQRCYPTISFSVTPFSFCLNRSQHQHLLQRVGSSHQVAKVLKLQLQHQSFQWIFRVDFLYDRLVWSPCCTSHPQESSPTSQFKSINSSVLSFLYSPTFTSTQDYWKNHSFDYIELCWQSDVSVFFFFLICYLGLSQLFFQGAIIF